MWVSRVLLGVVVMSLGLACGDTKEDSTPADAAVVDARAQPDTGADAGDQPDASLPPVEGRVKGRVTTVDGKPLAGLTVRSGNDVAKTDEQGRFSLEVREKDEARIAIDSDKYSSGATPVRVDAKSDANVELAVLERKAVMVEDASKGGRSEGADGFAVDLPEKALRNEDGSEVKGKVEVRYALVNKSKDVTAAPGRMEAKGGALEGYGMAEVRFYKDGKELKLVQKARFEIPLHADHGLTDGKEVGLFELGKEDKRWREGTKGMVKNGKVVVESDKSDWVGAAKALPVDSCVSGRLTANMNAAKNTTIRAARDRGLSLVQAETAEDGSFCLPVTPNDDWRVSTYYDDGKDGLGLEVPVNSADATGMCGGSGCKSVGDVDLPTLER